MLKERGVKNVRALLGGGNHAAFTATTGAALGWAWTRVRPGGPWLVPALGLAPPLSPLSGAASLPHAAVRNPVTKTIKLRLGNVRCSAKSAARSPPSASSSPTGKSAK